MKDKTMTSIWLCTATYGPENDVEPITVLGWTKEAALTAMTEVLEDGERIGGQGLVNEWIIGNPELQPVCGEKPTTNPVWRSEMFTPDEQNSMVILQMEEIRECLKDNAHEMLDELSLPECIVLVMDEGELNVLTECLVALNHGNVCIEDLESEHPEHIQAVKDMRRFGLIDETLDGNPLTPVAYDLLGVCNVT
jgi:hypothetical protein